MWLEGIDPMMNGDEDAGMVLLSDSDGPDCGKDDGLRKGQINLSKKFQFVIRYWLDFDLNAMNGVHSLAT